MGLLRSIGGAFRKVTDTVGKVAGFVSKPLSKVLEPLSGVLGKISNLPVIGPLASKAMGFISKLGPLASLAPGPLGTILGVMSKIGSGKGLSDLVGDVVKGAGGLDQMLPQGLKNISESAAWKQAQMLLPK